MIITGSFICQECGRSDFKNKKSLSNHKRIHNPNFNYNKKFNKSKEWLYKEYVLNKKSTQKIADELKLNRITILNWLRKYGIKARGFGWTKGLYKEKHPSWKGGKPYLDTGGYLVRRERGKRIQIHQEIYCKYNNLNKIPNGYCIHHKDGNKLNNNIENLEMMNISQHKSLHNKKRTYKKWGKRKL